MFEQSAVDFPDAHQDLEQTSRPNGPVVAVVRLTLVLARHRCVGVPVAGHASTVGRGGLTAWTAPLSSLLGFLITLAAVEGYKSCRVDTDASS